MGFGKKEVSLCMGKQSWGILGAFSIGMVRNPSQDRTKNLLTCILTTQYKASRILRDKLKETYLVIVVPPKRGVPA